MEQAKEHDGRLCAYGYVDCGPVVQTMELFVKERVFTSIQTGESFTEQGGESPLYRHSFCAKHSTENKTEKSN